MRVIRALKLASYAFAHTNLPPIFVCAHRLIVKNRSTTLIPQNMMYTQLVSRGMGSNLFCILYRVNPTVLNIIHRSWHDYYCMTQSWSI